jgi:FixJ family two-component response regulator
VAEIHAVDADSRLSFYEWLKDLKPQLARRVIWTCTVAPEGEIAAEIGRSGCQTLQKPFKSTDLLDAVEAILSADVQATPV